MLTQFLLYSHNTLRDYVFPGSGSSLLKTHTITDSIESSEVILCKGVSCHQHSCEHQGMDTTLQDRGHMGHQSQKTSNCSWCYFKCFSVIFNLLCLVYSLLLCSVCFIFLAMIKILVLELVWPHVSSSVVVFIAGWCTKANVSVTTDVSFTTREAKVAINQLCVNTFSYNVTNIHLHYSSVLHLVIFPAVSSKSSVFHVFGSSWFYILQTQLYQVLKGYYWPQIISGFLAAAEDKSQHIGLNKGNSGSNI